MILACVNDEISDDLARALKLGLEEGICHYELRQINSCRFPYYPGTVMDLLANMRDELGIKYTSVSPGIFKIPGTTNSHSDLIPDVWKDTVKEAHFLKTERILIFAGSRRDMEVKYPSMIKAMSRFTRLCLKEGLTVSLENSPSTCCCTADEILRLLEDIGEDMLKVNWDPGNAVTGGDRLYLDSYEKIKGYIDNVHVKDVLLGKNGEVTYVPVGEGIIDYGAQLARLKKDGYKGCVTIETHCKPAEDAFIKSVGYLKRIMKKLD